MKSVLIAGAGPSGLMAAWAALSAGYNDIVLFDPHPKPPDGQSAGVFYLHDRCGLPNLPSVVIHTYGEGTAREYAQKLYGNPDVKTSFPEQSRFAEVYDGMVAMNQLWEMFLSRIHPTYIHGIDELIAMTRTYDRVVSTVPLDVLYGSHVYQSVSSYIATAPAGPTLAYVEYHGDPLNPLYRASAVFGREALEFIPGYDPRSRITYDYQLHIVKKVVPSRVSMFIGHDRLLFTGRYGAWDKTCLTHHVYERTKGWLLSERPSERVMGSAVASATGADRHR